MPIMTRSQAYPMNHAPLAPNAPPAVEPGLVSLTERLDDGRRVPVQL